MSIDYTSFSDDNDIYNVSDSNDVEMVQTDIIEQEDVTSDNVLMGVVANCDRVYVRENADKNSDPLTDVANGTELLVTGTSDDEDGTGWYNVCTATGVEGYIMAKFVKLNE